MPEGLRELMSDISREVLRAQPPDIYEFITKYLSALLVTRENLSIASRICSHVCDSTCEPELEDELRYIGLAEEDLDTACAIIKEYFEEDGANENNLMAKLLSKTSMEPAQLAAVHEAVRRAFIRHQINNTVIYETLSESDEYSQAVSHTLDLYRKTKPTVEKYVQKAITLQAAYRAYGVRRQCTKKRLSEKRTDKKNIRFHETADTGIRELADSSTSDTTSTNEAINEDKPDDNTSKYGMVTVSSVSLAGSHLNLPTYTPYSNHGAFAEIDEMHEKENAIIDYVTEEIEIDRDVDYDEEFEDSGTEESEIEEQLNIAQDNENGHTINEQPRTEI